MHLKLSFTDRLFSVVGRNVNRCRQYNLTATPIQPLGFLREISLYQVVSIDVFFGFSGQTKFLDALC